MTAPFTLLTGDRLPNSSFSEELPNLQIAWDSTSLGYLKECPRKYYYMMVRGRQTRGESVHLTFGAHYHKALETYDHARSAGLPYEDAVDAALRYCLEATVERDASGGWRPWNSDDPNKNRFTLARTVVWYLLHFENDPLKTVQLSNGKPAVELSFRYEVDFEALPGQRFIFCGHIDRLVEEPETGAVKVLDRKTSKNTIYAESITHYKPDNQMGFYDFSAPIIWQAPVQGIKMDLAQVAVSFSRFLRGDIVRKDDERDEWYRDALFQLQLAKEFARQGYWPMNDKSCGNYGGCPFRPICSKPNSTRELWFVQTTKARAWDPLKVRGDI